MEEQKAAMSYLERISQTEEQQSTEVLYSQDKKAKLQWQADLLETEAKVVQISRELDNLLSSPELHSGDIMRASDDLDRYRRGLSFLQRMFVVLFPPQTQKDNIIDSDPEVSA